MPAGTYDRAIQDIGNILALEHVNLRIPDQGIATIFYVLGLGLTRDPYLMVGTDNMWINVGQQQFHLPTGDPQVLRGYIGVVVPDPDVLVSRLEAVRNKLVGTRFDYAVRDKHVSITCPWGNSFRCHAAGPEFGDMTLGIAYVEFPVKPGHASGIGKFYGTVLGAPATVIPEAGGAVGRVRVGARQELIFRETPKDLPPYDGHHIAIYIANFAGPHQVLERYGLLTEESNEYQYRFQDIVDLETRHSLFVVEHEVRSATHPMYMRPLVNRNPSQRQRTYVRGRDAFMPGMG